MKNLARGMALLAALAALGAVSASANEAVTYTYDALGRLIKVQNSGTVNPSQNVDTNFDPAGNRTNYAITGAASTVISVTALQEVIEGATLTFVVERTGNTTAGGSVNYASAQGSALAGSDYTSVSGTLTFAANELSKNVTVTTVNDATAEPRELMTFVLSSPTGGAALGSGSATGGIIDND